MKKRTTLLYVILTIFFINLKANSQEETIITSPDNSNFNVNDKFGYDTAIYEDKVLIGAIGDESEFGETGAAFVYKLNGSSWELEQKLAPNDGTGTFNGAFGYKVDLYNNIAFISAPGHNNSVGAVYIFEFDGTRWNQSTRLIASDALSNTRFGYRISCSNNRILVSNNPDFGVGKKTAYLFEKENGVWLEKAKLEPSNDVRSNNMEIALFNNVIVMTDAAYLNSNGIKLGAVYTFLYDNENWIESGIIEGVGSAYGQSVGLSENLLAVGSIYNVYLYEYIENQWEDLTTLSYPNEPGRNYALGISIDNEKILVGSFQEEATLFVKDNNSIWTKKLTLKPNYEDGLEIFNYGFRNISLQGNRISIGAPNWHGNNMSANGAVFLYDLQNTLAVTQHDHVKKGVFYPNPAHDRIILSDFLQNQVFKIEVFDISGKKLISSNYIESLDVSGLSKALYIIKIRLLDGSQFVEKLLLE